jgi:phosphate transport system substrate-binding protein
MNHLFRAVLAMCIALSTVSAAPVVAHAQEVSLTGSGSSFVDPFMQKLASEYHKLHPEIKINYTQKGSGTGIKELSDKVTDFGASDAPMTEAQLKGAAGGQIIHVPLVMGAVVPIYNVPGVNSPLAFSGPVLADIFRGKITAWNDPAITKLNPGVKLPDADITVVHRSDSSGTTYVFSEYLSKVSPDFAKAPGTGTALSWPAENKVGAKGNPGVAAVVQKTPGTIGYVELIYALSNKIPYGSVINAAVKPVMASMEGVSAAAASMKNPPADLRMSITNAEGDAAYPISAFVYVLVYQNQADATKGRTLVNFLKWAITDGQRLAPELHYAALPEPIVKLDQAKLDAVVAK